MNDLLLGKPWAQVPEEIVVAPISHLSLRVVLCLQLHRRPGGRAPFPSQTRLATMCGVSVPSIKRALAELREVGILVTNQRVNEHGRRSTNSHELRVPSRITGDTHQGSRMIPGPGIKDDPPEAEEGRQETEGALGERTPRPARAARAEAKARYDALWEAFVAAGVARPSTKAERQKLNTAVRQLLEIDAPPEEIAPRAERYKRTYPGIPFTAMGLVSHWAESGPRRERLASVRECPECTLPFPPVKLKEHRYSVHGIGDICQECGGVCQDDVRDSCPCGKLVSTG
jgi:hypothetical protein